MSSGIISDAEIALQRVLIGRHNKSQIMLGLHGTGKTVLRNKIGQLAESHNHIISFIEVPEKQSLPELMYPKIHQALRKLSMVGNAKTQAYAATRALRSFAGSFKISIGDFSLSVDPEPGVADSGILELDLAELTGVLKPGGPAILYTTWPVTCGFVAVPYGHSPFGRWLRFAPTRTPPHGGSPCR